MRSILTRTTIAAVTLIASGAALAALCHGILTLGQIRLDDPHPNEYYEHNI